MEAMFTVFGYAGSANFELDSNAFTGTVTPDGACYFYLSTGGNVSFTNNKV